MTKAPATISGNWGALGFLIAGNAALGLANMSDERIEELCLDSLPPEIAEEGRRLLVDRRVHRWMASVNAMPGGSPVRRRTENHRPDPVNLPRYFHRRRLSVRLDAERRA